MKLNTLLMNCLQIKTSIHMLNSKTMYELKNENVRQTTNFFVDLKNKTDMQMFHEGIIQISMLDER